MELTKPDGYEFLAHGVGPDVDAAVDLASDVHAEERVARGRGPGS